MITCKLKGKTYSVDFVSGRALREIGPAMTMMQKIDTITREALAGKKPEHSTKIEEAMDVLVKWFCLLFGNQFTPDEVYDNYPSDRMMYDISIAMAAVENNMTEVLSEFPTKPAAEMTTENE